MPIIGPLLKDTILALHTGGASATRGQFLHIIMVKSMNFPSKLFCLILIIGGLSMFSGCYNLARPQWFNPGTMKEQRLRAMRFDPYPDVDAGPEMVGVRPRGFDRPASEATKSQPSRFWGQ
ncbi:MAG: hypothetical protein COA78_09420 [Blastopirellula sp.]|nr:MAG: hypothetical protein COA78_09420 [Blastopirellula sp.]